MGKKQKSVFSKIRSRWQGYIADGRARAQRYLAARPHRSFRPTPARRYKRGKKVAKVWPLIIGTFGTIWQEKKTVGVLIVLFAAASFIFIGGVSQLTFVDLRDATSDLFDGNFGAFGTVSTLFLAALAGSLDPNVTPLQQFLAGALVLLFWLALVWVLRRRLADQPTSVREALYNSGAPIIPTVLVLLVIVIHLIPGAIGVIAATLSLSGVWLPGGVESMLITTAAVLLCLLSLYWVTASGMALITVTLSGMYPWRALSAASELVVGQRWRIAVRLISLVLVVVVAWAVVLIPAILLDGWLKFDWLPLVPAVVQLLSALTLGYVATYIYKMYRSML